MRGRKRLALVLPALLLAACAPTKEIRPVAMVVSVPAGKPDVKRSQEETSSRPVTESAAVAPSTPAEDPLREPGLPDAVGSAGTAVDPLRALETGYESSATYYAKKFNGRKTITGERYDPEKMTGATHEVPLGTRVRVINPQNGKEVVVRINDRPRKRNFALIDLSRAAARELGFLRQGRIKVRVIPLLPDAEP